MKQMNPCVCGGGGGGGLHPVRRWKVCCLPDDLVAGDCGEAEEEETITLIN